MDVVFQIGSYLKAESFSFSLLLQPLPTPFHLLPPTTHTEFIKINLEKIMQPFVNNEFK